MDVIINKSIDNIDNKKNVYTLNLSNNELNKLPREYFNDKKGKKYLEGFINLKELYLNDNKLKLAPYISYLDKLEKIELINNNLTVLPINNIRDLYNLKYFNLKNNKINVDRRPLAYYENMDGGIFTSWLFLLFSKIRSIKFK